jgi:hypothetical protein
MRIYIYIYLTIFKLIYCFNNTKTVIVVETKQNYIKKNRFWLVYFKIH